MDTQSSMVRIENCRIEGPCTIAIKDDPYSRIEIHNNVIVNSKKGGIRIVRDKVESQSEGIADA